MPVLEPDTDAGSVIEGVVMTDPLLYDRLLSAWQTLEAWAAGGCDVEA